MSSLLVEFAPIHLNGSVRFAEDTQPTRVDYATLASFDLLELPYAVFDAGGREVRRSAPAARLRSGDALWRQASELIRKEMPRPEKGVPLATGTRRFATSERTLEFVIAPIDEPSAERRVVAVLVPRLATKEVAPVRAVRSTISNRWSLTPRQLELAELLQLGLSTRAIAEELQISVHTARHHIEQVFNKLGVRSRTSAAVLLSERGALGTANTRGGAAAAARRPLRGGARLTLTKGTNS